MLKKRNNDNDDDYFEFVGNVKITLVDTKKEESDVTKSICSTLINLTYFFMGASTVMMLYFTINFRGPPINCFHILFCTIGYQLMLPASYLMESRFNGILKLIFQDDRKTEVCLVKVIGALLGSIGSYLIVVSEFNVFTDHAIFGLVAEFLAIIDFLLLPCSFVSTKHCFGRCMQFMGTPSYFFSSIAFIFACLKSNVIAWFPSPIISYFLVVFTIINTIVVMYEPFKKLITAANEE